MIRPLQINDENLPTIEAIADASLYLDTLIKAGLVQYSMKDEAVRIRRNLRDLMPPPKSSKPVSPTWEEGGL